MSKFFFVMMIAAMIAVLGVLVLGMISMIKGGEFNRKHGNKLMRLRVWLQAAAIVLFAATVIAMQSGS